MARKKSKFTYENQATLSIVLAAVGGVAFLLAAGLLWRNFTDFETFWVSFNPKSMYQPLLGLVLFIALAVGAVGFFIGLNSAGQRRNTRSRLSWLGFFLNAGVIALALCAGIFFVIARHPFIPR
ncbi:MAG: hypothetical protein KAY37_09305 [Phycisphaerae bacterium]|nr:hypothetical protein [Phycisphaerae bacterium]